MKSNFNKMINRLSNQEEMANVEKEIQKLEKEINSARKKLDYLSNKVNEYEYKSLNLARENNVMLRDIERNIKNIEKLSFYHLKGLNKEVREQKIIVSMTSFPARIHYVHLSLDRLFLQTLRPDKIVLYLSKDQFPNLEFDLPYQLLEYKKIGLEIKWCDGDTKAYKKVLPALKEYQDDIVIIVDDDLIYDVDMVEDLYRGHLVYPKSIIALT